MNLKYPVILEPKRATEFELQAELYSRLKSIGVRVRGEVRARSESGQSQFDLVVFVGGMGFLIIEVKDSSFKKRVNGTANGCRQVQKYNEFGIPVIYYTTITPIEHVIEMVRNYLKNPPV